MQADQEPDDPNKPQWLSYEELVPILLNRMRKVFGLQSVEGKQKIRGKRSGTTMEIDGKATIEGGKGFFIVECRRYTKSKLNKGKIRQLAYEILDARADGAILVSPMGLQKGAAKIADVENILSVELNENSTLTDFALKFLDKIYVGISITSKATMSATPRMLRTCSKCGKPFPVVGNETLCKDCAG